MKSKKESKSLVFIIVLLIVIVFGVFGYFVYYKYLDKKPVYATEIKEDFKAKKSTNQIYQSSDVLTKGKRKYLVVKKNDKWYEVDYAYSEDNVGFQVIGAYKDILYYVDSKGIKYVDLNSEKLKPAEYAVNDMCDVDSFYAAYFDKDTLYVEVLNNSYDANTEDEKTAYSIISYDLNKSYITAKGKSLINIEDGPISFYVIDEKVFYLYDYNNGLYKLKQYAIENDKTSIVTSDVCDMDIYKDHLIVTKINPIDENESCSLHYFINAYNGKDIFVSNKEFHSVMGDVLYFQDSNKIYEFVDETGKISFISNGRMDFNQDTLYYLNKNKVYKYENGKSVILYTGEEQYKIRGFNIDNSTGKEIIFIYTRAGNYAIVDGKKQDAEETNKDILKYEVNMKNGSVITFDYSTDDIDNISYDEKLDENKG